MKQNIVLTVIFSLLIFVAIMAQNTIYYSYDTNGNVYSRCVIYLTPQSESRAVTADNDSIEKDIIIKDKIMDVEIYPNPTRGLLKIRVPDFESDNEFTLILFDLSGKKITETRMNQQELDLNLSAYPNGTYILILKRGNKLSEWKIVKTS